MGNRNCCKRRNRTSPDADRKRVKCLDLKQEHTQAIEKLATARQELETAKESVKTAKIEIEKARTQLQTEEQKLQTTQARWKSCEDDNTVEKMFELTIGRNSVSAAQQGVAIALRGLGIAQEGFATAQKGVTTAQTFADALYCELVQTATASPAKKCIHRLHY